jgi:hypothetical protein
VFTEIVNSVSFSFQLEQDFVNVESALLQKEGELRVYAKKEVEGLLSNKVIQIRKDVE